jgi:glutamine phosphoribosylpyrophosphate amidotransferase
MNGCCAFNIIYGFDGAHSVHGLSVASMRKALAVSLAKAIEQKSGIYNYVVPIPNTGAFYSGEIAKNLNIKELRLFRKKCDKRTLSLPNEERKEYYIKRLVRESVKLKNAKILLVDEALISGLTLGILSANLKASGVESFSVAFVAPPVYCHCPWGLMGSKERLGLGMNGDVDQTQYELSIKHHTGCTNVYFNTFKDFDACMPKHHTCKLCFKPD